MVKMKSTLLYIALFSDEILTYQINSPQVIRGLICASEHNDQLLFICPTGHIYRLSSIIQPNMYKLQSGIIHHAQVYI